MPTTPRRRAAVMDPDERRAAIVQVALPLLAEHGVAITTKQVAVAAGIAEGTVFRVFTDKSELMRVCVAEAFRTDRLCADVGGISAELTLSERLRQAGMLIHEHFSTLGQLLQTLTTTGYDSRRHESEAGAGGPLKFMHDVAAAVATVLAPEEHRLNLPPDTLARMFLGLLMSVRFDPDGGDKDTHLTHAVRLLLRGALS